MRVVVIGATGHIGTYLVPRLVEAGHEVIAVSRGARQPYRRPPVWERVSAVQIDRAEAERHHSFGREIAALQGDAVIDLILFHPDSLPQLLEALEGRIRHFLYCGTMWVYGPTEKAPTTESEPRLADQEYGQNKARLEELLIEASLKGRLSATVLHPGHIVGPGWAPINPAGNLDLNVFERLGHGEEVCLPDNGLATLHHVHADDVAQAFELALADPAVSISQSFNVISPAALTLRGYCRAVAGWFGREAKLTFAPWPDWEKTVSRETADETWEHIRHSPVGSSEKAQRMLGYSPRYSSLQAVREALAWLIRNGDVNLPALD